MTLNEQLEQAQSKRDAAQAELNRLHKKLNDVDGEAGTIAIKWRELRLSVIKGLAAKETDPPAQWKEQAALEQSHGILLDAKQYILSFLLPAQQQIVADAESESLRLQMLILEAETDAQLAETQKAAAAVAAIAPGVALDLSDSEITRKREGVVTLQGKWFEARRYASDLKTRNDLAQQNLLSSGQFLKINGGR